MRRVSRGRRGRSGIWRSRWWLRHSGRCPGSGQLRLQPPGIGIPAAERIGETLAGIGIEAEVIDKWKNSPARDQAGRESLWTYLQLLQKLKAQLTSTMESGKLAALDLQHAQTMKDKLRKVWDGMRSA